MKSLVASAGGVGVAVAAPLMALFPMVVVMALVGRIDHYFHPDDWMLTPGWFAVQAAVYLLALFFLLGGIVRLLGRRLRTCYGPFQLGVLAGWLGSTALGTCVALLRHAEFFSSQAVSAIVVFLVLDFLATALALRLYRPTR